MMKAGPSQEDVRRHNLGTLLRFVHLRGPASRATLAESLGLNRSTIMALTSDLTAAYLVREELPRAPGAAPGGRPSSSGPSPPACTCWRSRSASTGSSSPASASAASCWTAARACGPATPTLPN